MDPSNILKSLEYDTDFSSEVNDDFLDPDFSISDRENDELDGILAFDTDSDCNENNEPDFLLPELNVIDETSDDEHTPPSPKGKKRKLNLSKWERNMSKEKKAKGIGHILLRKKVVPPRLTGPDCLCRKKCFVNVVDEDRISLISIFNNIGDKSKQDTFLGGLIHLKPVSRQRSRNGSRPNKTCSVQYEVRLGINVISVCKKAFCSIFGVGKTAVDRIVKKLQNNIPSPSDNRGKHHNRPNKLPADIHFQINTHINSFPKRQSHYIRLDNSNTRYLSPDLSVAKLYRLFLQKYEPDFWTVYSEDRETVTMKPRVKYPYFAKYFASNFNISFAYPRSDTYQTCDQLLKSIQNETDAEKHPLM